MTHWGKVIGFASGLASGTTWAALLGLILGHQFDRGFAENFTRLGRERRAGDGSRAPAGYVDALFEAAGHVAKADGRVTEAEIRATRALMHRLGLGPQQIKNAVTCFERGKHPDWPLHDTMRRLRRDTQRNAELRSLFVRSLLEIALSKKSLHRQERAALWEICSELGVGRAELAQLEALLRAQRAFRQSDGSRGTPRTRLDAAYSVLGVAANSTDAEIKTAYRRLMNKYHPDKLGAAEDATALKAAELRTREIRWAYDALKQRRSIR